MHYVSIRSKRQLSACTVTSKVRTGSGNAAMAV